MPTIKGKEKATTSRSSSGSFSSEGGGAPLREQFGAFAFDSPQPVRPKNESFSSTIQTQQSPQVVSSRNRARSDAVFMSPVTRDVAIKSDTSFQLGDARETEDVFAAENFPSTVFPTEHHMTSRKSGIPCTIVRTEEDPDSDRNVGTVDAQVHYPGTACVFVANLPESAKDSRLEAAVTSAFSKFGLVFVKIRRDNRNMPFAFAQYTRDEDAEVALRDGRGTIIEGRPCRTEKVRGNRLFIICRRDSSPVSTEDAVRELSRVGPIVRTEYINQDVLDALNIANGVMVEFKNFDPDRDVVAMYRRNQTYRVIPYDVKKHDIAMRIDADRRYLEHYDIERRSVFIGRLPTDIPPEAIEKEIRSVMAEAGEVKAVTVISKPPNPERHTAVAFAFCEFTTPDMAIRAVNTMNGILIFDTKVKVEAKASRESPMLNTRPNYVSRSEASPARTLRSYRSAQTLQPATPPALNRKRSAFRIAPGEAYTDDVSTLGFSPFRFPAEYPSPAAMSSPYGVDAAYGMGVPMTPQFSPYAAYNAAAAFSPAPGAWTPYSWATPYLHDPRYAQAAAAATAYQQSPLPEYKGRHGEGLGEIDTPTKTTSIKVETLPAEADRRE